MRPFNLKTYAVRAVAVGFGALSFGGPASALSPLEPTPSASLIVPIMGEEDDEVERDLRPDEAMEAPEGAEKPAMEAAPKEAGGGNIEDETIDRIVPDAPGAP